MKTTLPGLLTLMFFPLAVSGAEIEWSPEANMDHQLFPALILATATVRPVEPEDEEGAKPDPSLLGERFGLVGISIKATEAKAKIKVTVKANELMEESSWSGELPEAGQEYFIAPKVNYNFAKLRQVTQQKPLNVTFALEADDESAGEKHETLQVRSINDCPFAVATPKKRSTTRTTSPVPPSSVGCSLLT
jgi:hypothetical protein